MAPSAGRPPTRRRLLRGWTALLTGVLLLLGGLTAASPAQAASLTQVTGFGSNPGSLNMYSYVPDNLPANAPLVLALHGCTQSANDYYSHSGWPKYADLYGFALVFPEQPSLTNPIENCFDWGTPSNDGRGKGEALSIYQMIQYAESNYHVDPSRIYITGLSAGAGMTADLLADYPDVFAAGSIDSGPAAQCSTTGITNTNCTSGTTSKTVQQWGDLIRGSDSGYAGPWPRVAIWQGSSDTTVNPAELTYNMDGWTNVWGIGQTPSSTQTLTGGTTENIYNDGSGNPAVETYSVSGMTHGLAVNPGSATDQCGTTGTYYLNTICSSYYTAQFFGLAQGGGGGGTGGLAAPTGVTVTGTTGSSASLSWNAVSGAAGYDVYRNGTLVTSSPVTATSYTDSGLSGGTTYSYTVAAVDSSGTVGTRSTAVSATTTGGAAQCFTDNNYNQVAAGRAHQTLGETYANGSNQDMGLYNLYVTHTLKETSAGYYVIADGTC
ncbi:extracellular catalytic domain type 1 short-chain-length polyhydroxyalkanoate depolymerase [Phaeacidiphilus oryzae]|uniref:extracellular catalytic domain type 1 short-chain-length polyhydroxyalkanoate depolymerase n=1 Tax=Phaeacidiphilus oryzae TaxID=348818 RepID=UPI00068EC91D|nr:PHB depolymerase family esterase [Phaeacidiphilus oryzae]